MGARRGDRFACRQFFNYFRHGQPHAAAARLPFMIAELAMIAAIAGLFSRKISQNGWMAFPAVLLAFVGGRIFFLLLAAIFQNIAPFTAAAVWSQITTGLLGLVVPGGFGAVFDLGDPLSCRSGQKS